MTIDGRMARGERTRAAVLDAAMALATSAGLDGLSLTQLAGTLQVSKSGLFAHWRSKKELQLATIDHAAAKWSEQVIGRARQAPRGVRRLWALHEARLDYYATAELPGVCFFGKTRLEFNARPGPVQDRLTAHSLAWLALIERFAAEAVAAGELRADADPRQLAYEIEALGLVAVLKDPPSAPEAYVRSRRAVLDRLRGLSTDPTLLPED
ncbi:TetR/AcrR family transcriptional regulator [Melissospora conviva]|uniref:TetR/AcrR family transcriptional regulator n=1 Tax=Melissospora conviva TaxID=3388432 RepID=UPI003B7E1355